ncbi:MAG: hypothetical protein NUV44_05955 [Candidatus Scalindua sp.]|nr:hypothetical protein [Candidatus Scalindua sp.]
MSSFDAQSYSDSVIMCENAKEAVDIAFTIIENKEKCKNGTN